MRYELLDAPGDFHVGATGLARIRDEIDDVQYRARIGCCQMFDRNTEGGGLVQSWQKIHLLHHTGREVYAFTLTRSGSVC